MNEIVLNANMRLAWEFIEHTDTSVFLTGKAGTGKTTFLRYVVSHTTKTCVVTAPTGVAAINAGGVTLHSFFQLPLAPFVPGSTGQSMFRIAKEKLRIIRAMDLLIIDEISMVRSDLLDAIDASLRRLRGNSKPFGGVQLLMIGDLQQLAPVVTRADQALLEGHYLSPYFFGSKALADIPYVTVALTQIFRQQEPAFLQLLAHVRSNSLSSADRKLLNSRLKPDFNPDLADGYIRLTTHNRQADSYNAQRLASLPGTSYTFSATIQGNFPPSSFPTDSELVLKPGAQVMFIKNDNSPDHLFYNGKIGRVEEIDSRHVRVRCLDDDAIVDVTPMEWENARYEVNEQTNTVETKVEGTFSQLPLRLAWAITIHKSQGLTFNRAVIDAGQAFAPGQVYVALSRCRTLEGLVLATPLRQSVMMSDVQVLDFITEQLNHSGMVADRLTQMQSAYLRTLMLEMFNFGAIGRGLHNLRTLAGERMGTAGATLATIIYETATDIGKSITDVAVRWRLILERLPDNRLTSEAIQTKLHNAAAYFLEKLNKNLIAPLQPLSKVKPANKVVAKRWSEIYGEFTEACVQKQYILEAMQQKPFTTAAYLQARRDGVLKASSSKKARKINIRAKKRHKSD